MTLADRARQMGRDAALEVWVMRSFEKPTLNEPAWGSARPHARYLLGRDATRAELEVVAGAWQAGVDEAWTEHLNERRN